MLGGFELQLVQPAALMGRSGIHQVVSWASIVTAGLCVLASVIALAPRVKRVAGSKPSHIFYGAIASEYRNDYGSFADALQKTCCDDEVLRDQISNQIWEVSRIAAIKSFAVKWGARLLAISLLLAALASAAPSLRG